MTILDFVKNPESFKRAGNKDGGEYHGKCPACGGRDGSDRFHIWPMQGTNGTYWCRSCDIKGDAIQYLRDIEQKSYHEACKILGTAITTFDPMATPKSTNNNHDTMQARSCKSTEENWREHAEKFVNTSHAKLIDNEAQRKWLSARGIDTTAIIKYRLGWNETDEYRVRSSWGLPEILKEDGKSKKLWLPAGLTIPYINGNLQRLRIRRITGEPRYYLTPGSNTAPMICHGKQSVVVIVESELDAIAIAAVTEDICTAISLGNSTARPDSTAGAIIDNAAMILIALDNDHAGKTEFTKWEKWHRAAKWYPVPVGKDPGEAVQQGCNLREWIISALPLSLRPSKVPETKPTINITVQNKEMISRRGVKYYIANTPEKYRELRAEQKTVFSEKEINMTSDFIKLAETKEQGENTADLIMESKKVFKGSFIKSVNYEVSKNEHLS